LDDDGILQKAVHFFSCVDTQNDPLRLATFIAIGGLSNRKSKQAKAKHQAKPNHHESYSRFPLTAESSPCFSLTG
jgi:hypothetical protein